MTLEELKKEINNRERFRKISCGFKIGILFSTYLIFKSKHMTPFNEDILKYYVPSIETINEDNERTKPVLDYSKKTLEGYKDVKLLVEYNTAYEKMNNGLYRKIRYVYSYQNMKEEDIKDIVDNPFLLDEFLTKESEFPEYRETIDEKNNNPTYNIQVLNKDKAVYLKELEGMENALIDTITYLLLNGTFLGMLYLFDIKEKQDLEKLKDEYQVLSRKRK